MTRDLFFSPRNIPFPTSVVFLPHVDDGFFVSVLCFFAMASNVLDTT